MKEVTKENIEKLEEAARLLSECGVLAHDLDLKANKAEELLEDLGMDEASDIDLLVGFSGFERLSCELSNKCTEYEIELEFSEEIEANKASETSDE